MKRRKFVKASFIGAGALAFTPITSVFAQKKEVSSLDLNSVSPEISSHYAMFSDDFFANLPEGARNKSMFQNTILPAKTICNKTDSKGYNLTFLNRNGDKITFVKRNGVACTIINGIV